uniref:EGF-like domain-containing protein n=1 Tax=Globodera pallida TaxID=36090 RepID=A0A183C579_GLOPA
MPFLKQVDGLQCQRAQKDDWANATESWDSSCPYRKGTEERCYFMNCSNGNSYQAEWGCIADFGYAHFQCSASCFNKNGFTCKCLLGIEGVDMSNKNMAIIIPAGVNNFNYNYDDDFYKYDGNFYNYNAFYYDFHCDFHFDYSDAGCSFNVFSNGIAKH